MKGVLRILLAAAIAVTGAASCIVNDMGTLPNTFVNHTAQVVEVVHVAPDGKETVLVAQIKAGGQMRLGQTLETRSLCSSGQLVARVIPGGSIVASRPLPLPNHDSAPCGSYWEIGDGEATSGASPGA